VPHTRGALVLGADVVTVGTVIGALIGIITFLLRILVAAKTKHIEALERELADVIAERNLYRDLSMSGRGRVEP
jgi:ADP-ribosylglycohydrolase